MTLATNLASHAVEASLDGSSEYLRDARNRVVDVLGCMIAGIKVDPARRAADVIAANSGAGGATAVSSRSKVKPGAAAQANALLTRAYDFGPLTPFDGENPIWSHISETTVPVALALAEDCGASVHSMLEALIIADDVAARMSRALKFVPGTGWDSPGLINRFASAVIAARLWNLEPDDLVRGWGLVLQQVSGTFQAIEEHSDAFTYVQGLSARDGIEAMDLVRHGYAGGQGALDGRFGLFHTYGTGNQELGSIVAGLGEVYFGDQIFKPYPGCRFTHGPIEIAGELREILSSPSNIQEILLSVHPHHIGSPLDLPVERPISRSAALFSFQFQTANALLRGTPGPADYDDFRRNDPEVQRLAGLVRLQPAADPSFELTGAHLEIRMSDGSSAASRIDYPCGDPRGVSMKQADIDAKFVANLQHAEVKDRGQALVSRLREALASDEPPNLFPYLHSSLWR